MLLKPLLKPLTGAVPLAQYPLTLFAQGEQGIFLDPSDLSTLFQDAAGTIPVELNGDPVGLVLDKSQRLALGPELVTNGDFSSASDWIVDEWSIASGQASITGATSDFRLLYQPLVRPLVYRVTVDLTVTSGVVSFFDGSSYSTEFGVGSSGTYSFLVGNTNQGYGFFTIRAAPVGTTAVIRSVSVRAVQGGHASQSISASRPTYLSGALVDDGIDDEMISIIPSIPAATVAISRSTGAEITYPVDLSSGQFIVDGTGYGWIILDRQLTAIEESTVTRYLDKKAGL